MRVLVSACLLGRPCKYNGGSNYHPGVVDFLRGHEVVEVCPECEAGLGTPREPVEIVEGRLLDRRGNSVDEALTAAVEQILLRLAREPVDCAVLQPRSPSCGLKQIYDGSFSGRLIEGSGVFARALLRAGIPARDAGEF